MLVTARLRPPGNTVEVADAKRVDELLQQLDILPSTVLVLRGTELLTADAELVDGDQIEIRYAISGGAT